MIAANTRLPAPQQGGPGFQRRQAAAQMSCMATVASPRRARWLAKALFFLFLATLIGLIFLPWQQTVVGRGQVLAFKPTERAQAVAAPISGLVTTWHVVEGTRVKAGDPIVDLVDPDPDFERRLKIQKDALSKRQNQFTQQITERNNVINELKTSRDRQIEIADKGVDIAKQTVEQRKKVVGTREEALTLNKREIELFTIAVEKGLRAEIELIRLKTQANQAELEVQRARADQKAAEESQNQAEANIPRVRADANRLINESLQAIEALEGERFAVEQQLQTLDVQMARYASRFVKAPCDGTVFRVEENAGQGGAQVKEGTVLATIVPDSDEYVVELFIDGVDAPLITQGPDGRYPHVRIQFEGWPAVQFTGWPSAAYGTFGGRVKQVDRTDNGKGQFRVLIEPDPYFEDDAWPSQEFLRQGNQAVGWVFLQRVTLGWEVWRRLNGFPPIVAPEEPGKKKDKENKPLKVKVS